MHETEGLFALAGENSQESLWKEELDSLNRLYTFLQPRVDVLVTLSDRLCPFGTCASGVNTGPAVQPSLKFKNWSLVTDIGNRTLVGVAHLTRGLKTTVAGRAGRGSFS